jgi:hypothetical protein
LDQRDREGHDADDSIDNQAGHKRFQIRHINFTLLGCLIRYGRRDAIPVPPRLTSALKAMTMVKRRQPNPET